MKCQVCGKKSTVHVAGLDLSGWSHTWYCEECRSHLSSRNILRCNGCGILYTDFLETGILGCSSCYTSFAMRLEPLMEKYGNRTPGPLLVGYRPGRMAGARTQELHDTLYGNPQEEASDSVHGGCDPVLERRFQGGTEGESAPWGSGCMGVGDGILESCRIRVARNLKGLPYLSRMNRAQRDRFYAILLGERGGLNLRLGEAARGMEKWYFRIYGGDEDHLRAEWIFSPAENFPDAVQSILGMRDLLDSLYQWQFHPDYGFLTACPGNAGSGVRLSFQMELPSLRSSALWPQWQQELTRAGFEIRGEKGEGSPVTGRMQISNRNWAGDEDLLSGALAMFQVIKKLEERERMLRRSG